MCIHGYTKYTTLKAYVERLLGTSYSLGVPTVVCTSWAHDVIFIPSAIKMTSCALGVHTSESRFIGTPCSCIVSLSNSATDSVLSLYMCPTATCLALIPSPHSCTQTLILFYATWSWAGVQRVNYGMHALGTLPYGAKIISQNDFLILHGLLPSTTGCSLGVQTRTAFEVASGKGQCINGTHKCQKISSCFQCKA